ncbi:MAG TPA: DNA polymerase I, partial [Kiritimatiellia bacterium]|nr:DNA polymerase I [Kiritimatiellia bacterium]
PPPPPPPPPPAAPKGELFAPAAPAEPPPAPVALKTIHDVPHTYRLIDRDDEVAALVEELGRLPRFCFDIETDRLNPKLARIAGIAFSWERGHGVYVRIPRSDTVPAPRLALLAPILQRPGIEKIGHNLKFDMGVLLWNGVEVHGPVFDTMIAHALLEPDRRHGMDALSEQYLGYTPIPFDDVVGAKGPTQTTMFDAPAEKVAEYAAEDADVTWQLHGLFAERLREAGLDRVFREIEMPLLPVLLHMEKAGIRLDRATLATTSTELAAQLLTLETRIHDLAGGPFNINSPRQLGEVLFERMALGGPKAKKTRTGQYATDESILSELATEHEIARRLLEYREAAKLKSTYVDALPETVFPPTGRIHTTFMPTGAVTGRLASVNPNLQNIPIRTEAGQGIRAAFLPTEGWQLLSADYSQIELRVMASLSGDPGMIDAFARGLDIHAATAARVYRVELDQVTADMRRTAKMVNFGIIYGISAFGLAQRLGIPRSEAASIIQQYFVEYPGVKAYMEQVVATCRTTGYVETMTGRRRWIRDITSANGTVRAAAERTAINTPIQGTAADMIKIAMVRIDTALRAANLRTTMLLQVHDELVFDLAPGEEDAARALIVRGMKDALPLNVPVEVQTGIGATWLAAHG